MKVVTEITAADWTAFAQFAARNSGAIVPGQKRRGLLLGLAGGTVLGFALSAAGHRLHVPSMGVGILASFLVIGFILHRQRARLSPAPDGVILGPREVTLTDEGLRETSPRHSSLIQWPGVRGAKLTARHVFVMVDTIAAIIIPLTSFTSDQQRDEFLHEIERRTNPAA